MLLLLKNKAHITRQLTQIVTSLRFVPSGYCRRYATRKTMKAWKETEEVVAIIEQSISPRARVETDVHLPVLLSNQGATRQCDVVIWQGDQPRQTLTIVEVQDRKSKVDINTFNGWCTKMRDVGAQHLICVSKVGFPKSIKEKAEHMGPTVRLIEFSQLDDGEWPHNFFSNTLQNPQRKIIDVCDVELHYEHTSNTEIHTLNFKMDQRDFIYNGIPANPFEILIRYIDHLEGMGAKYDDGEHTIEFSLPLPNQELKIRIDGDFKRVISFKGVIVFTTTKRELKFDCCRYRQIDYGSDIAWLMEATASQNGQEKIVKIVIVQDGPGSYRIDARL